ncbi:MAG: Omp28-related outer membrane protein [Flavobacteriaceae bacterium]|nr:Omp28-related outer membrane protein [Flavobacteriaceae bacterium]
MTKKTSFISMLLCAIFSTSIAQTYFTDDFSDGNISDWTQYDADGDGHKWFAIDLSSYIFASATIASFSWHLGAFTPDNYIVSPAIDLTNASGSIVLKYAYGSFADAPKHSEKYSVYVTTANDLTTLQGATAIHTETLANPETRETNSLDVSTFAGQTIYVTFRHHDCTNKAAMVIDDVVVRAPLNNDAFLKSVSLNRYSLPSTDNTLSMEVTNNGTDAISSLEVNWNDGTTDNISTINVNIAAGATASVDHPTPVNYANIVELNLTATITAVNGTADGDTSNNTQNDILFNTVTQTSTKALLIEETTGTWCGYCPKGAVGLDHISTTYPNTTVPIAVHGGNGDPMEVPEYKNGISNFTSGYPDGVIDRATTSDPSASSLEDAYNSLLFPINPVDLDVTSTLSGSDLTITADATFYTNISSANYKLAGIIIENGVTGTNSGYDQVNAYSGGSTAMGGYENLPNPVPAAQMVYDHVGRALLGGFDGVDNSIPVSISAGDNFQTTFNYTIPATSNQDDMYIAIILINSDTGVVINAFQKSINESLSTSDLELASAVSIYPNPATDKFNIAFDASNANYAITITDMLGRTVLAQQHNNLSGNNTIEISTNQFSAGQYIVTIATSNTSYSKRLIINN